MLYLYLSLLTSEKDKSFFEKIYLEHRDFMYAYANKILHDRHLAEDAVHNAFLKVVEHLERISEMDCHKARAFLVIVVKNTSINIYNERKGSPVIDVCHDISDEGKVKDNIHMRFDVEALLVKIRELPELYREVLLLRYFHEFSNKEISQILAISETNTRKRIERAKALLFDAVGKEASCNA